MSLDATLPACTLEAGGTTSRPATIAQPALGRRLRLILEIGLLFIAGPLLIKYSVFGFRMPLFVVLAPDRGLDDELIGAIARRVREDCSPRHVPSEVFAVAEIPRTLSGKVLEVPIKKILMGADPATAASRGSLANPEAYDWFVAFAQSRTAG